MSASLRNTATSSSYADGSRAGKKARAVADGSKESEQPFATILRFSFPENGVLAQAVIVRTFHDVCGCCEVIM